MTLEIPSLLSLASAAEHVRLILPLRLQAVLERWRPAAAEWWGQLLHDAEVYDARAAAVVRDSDLSPAGMRRNLDLLGARTLAALGAGPTAKRIADIRQQ